MEFPFGDEQKTQNIKQEIDVSQIHPAVVHLLGLPPQPEQGTEAWHAQRDAMTITGSDAACVLDGTPWKSAFKSRNMLFQEKTKQRARSSVGGWAVQHGNYYEDEALQKYMERTGEKALLFGLLPHPTIPWLGASPDAATWTGRLVEIKV